MLKRRNMIATILVITVSITIIGWLIWYNLQPSTQELPFETKLHSSQTEFMRAPDATFLVDGKAHNLDQYKGRKVILWLFSTWCSSCEAGLQALWRKHQVLEKRGVVVLILNNYQNGDYPGPSVRQFVRAVAPDVLHSAAWVVGNSSRQMAGVYNQKDYPDIYYLINRQGSIVKINSSPDVTMPTILAFAGSAG